MFARARILARPAEGALLLPVPAIQQVDGKPLVFVKRADDLFEARAVTLERNSTAVGKSSQA